MKKMVLGGVVLVSAALLGACSLTLPVRGQIADGSERFSGTATGYLDRSGTLQISSGKGTVCTGDFVYVTSRYGEGVFVCNDGRSGPFTFSSTGSSGVGSGRIGDQIFTFTFGN